jgi:hypothetical protein
MEDNLTYIFAFVILIIPFGLIWFLLVRLIKNYINTPLNYSVLLLFTFVALIAYCGLCGALTVYTNSILDGAITAMAYTTLLISVFLFLASLLITLIFLIIHIIEKPKVN